jgi:preprotein translocase subunit YajC
MENLILPALVLAAYLAFVYPQLKRKRDYRALQAALAEGDEVVMDSGLHGIITDMDATVVYLDVADGVELKFSRNSIASRLSSADDDDDSP